jgi:hypothetical protein
MGMTGVTITLTAWLALVSPTPASLTTTKAPGTVGRDVLSAQVPQRAAQDRPQPPTQETQEEFVMMARTVVRLNERRCAYRDVPAHARIVWMSVAADRKSVLEVHFRTGK